MLRTARASILILDLTRKHLSAVVKLPVITLQPYFAIKGVESIVTMIGNRGGWHTYPLAMGGHSALQVPSTFSA